MSEPAACEHSILVAALDEDGIPDVLCVRCQRPISRDERDGRRYRFDPELKAWRRVSVDLPGVVIHTSERITAEQAEEIQRLYRREVELTTEIGKRNRHSSIDGHWYGPALESCPAYQYCNCSGCFARFYQEERSGLEKHIGTVITEEDGRRYEFVETDSGFGRWTELRGGGVERPQARTDSGN